MEPILSVKDLKVSVEGRTILSGISFDVKPRESVVIIGANGSGKTLLLKTLMGFMKPASGTFTWKPGIRIGYVPQKFSLDKKLPILVKEFIGLKSGVVEQEALASLITDVGLDASILSRNMGTLSGGQAQRVLIAWALSDNPDVLIFDEPTESIDMAGEHAIYELVDSLKKNKGITVFMVSHDLDVVYKYGDKVLCLAGTAMICSEDPRNVLDQKKIEEVYGRAAHTYHH